MTYTRLFNITGAALLSFSLIFFWLAYETPKFAEAALTDSLLHWYDCEDDGGGNTDDSHSTGDLTANGGATLTTGTGGKVGEGCDIPDTGTDYFELAGATDIDFSSTEDRTFAFWVKRESGTTRDRIMGIWDGTDKNFLYVYWDSEEARAVSGYDGTTGTAISGTTDISTDAAWHFVVITYDGTADDKFRIYIDGATTAEATSAAESSLNGSNAAFRIGYVDGNTPDMKIDSIGIWSKVISSAEITSLYNSDSGVDYDGLTATPAVETPAQPPLFFSGYDVFLLAGQSNVFSGEPYPNETTPDAILDASDSDIFQVGRWDGENNQIVLAEEPLDHLQSNGSRPAGYKVGWGLAFAKKYKQDFLVEGRGIILVPSARGGSGLADNQWNKGNTQYNDAISRVQTALNTSTGCEATCNNQLKGILWHQGEDDTYSTVNANNYETSFLSMVDNFRTDLGDSNLPFVSGGMVEDWVIGDVNRETVQTSLDITGERLYTGFADSTGLTSIDNPNHFAARSVRGYPTQDFNNVDTLGLAGRYFTAYQSAIINTGTTPPDPETFYCYIQTFGSLTGLISTQPTTCL